MWWTRDTAHHADCAFKVYRKIGTQHVFEEDLDENLRVMTKYKGERGKVVSTVGLNKCPHFASHI